MVYCKVKCVLVLFCECSRCCFFQPVSGSVVGVLQSLQAIVVVCGRCVCRCTAAVPAMKPEATAVVNIARWPLENNINV